MTTTNSSPTAGPSRRFAFLAPRPRKPLDGLPAPDGDHRPEIAPRASTEPVSQPELWLAWLRLHG